MITIQLYIHAKSLNFENIAMNDVCTEEVYGGMHTANEGESKDGEGEVCKERAGMRA